MEQPSIFYSICEYWLSFFPEEYFGAFAVFLCFLRILCSALQINLNSKKEDSLFFRCMKITLVAANLRLATEIFYLFNNIPSLNVSIYRITSNYLQFDPTISVVDKKARFNLLFTLNILFKILLFSMFTFLARGCLEGFSQGFRSFVEKNNPSPHFLSFNSIINISLFTIGSCLCYCPVIDLYLEIIFYKSSML